MEATLMLVEAIRRTPGDYLQQVLDSRNPGHPSQKGSVWMASIDDKEDLLRVISQEEVEEFVPEGGGFVPRADRPCRYIRVAIYGYLGVMPLADLPPETEVVLLDPKGTCGTPGGGVQAHLPNGGEKLGVERWATFILGPNDTPEGEYILWTCHPGAPARYTPVDRPDLVGKTVTVREAIEFGLTGVNLR